MIIPNVQLRNLAVRLCKRFRPKPPDIVVQIVVVTLGTEALGERIMSSLLGVADASPRAKGP